MRLLGKLIRRDPPGAPHSQAATLAVSAEERQQTGVELMRRGLYREAAEEFRQSLRQKPDSAETLYNLGLVYDYLSDLKKSVGCYERVIRLDPGFAEAHSNLGAAYSKL